jgi:hypothetical protein
MRSAGLQAIALASSLGAKASRSLTERDRTLCTEESDTDMAPGLGPPRQRDAFPKLEAEGNPNLDFSFFLKLAATGQIFSEPQLELPLSRTQTTTSSTDLGLSAFRIAPKPDEGGGLPRTGSYAVSKIMTKITRKARERAARLIPVAS